MSDELSTVQTGESLVTQTRKLIDELTERGVVARALGGVAIGLLCPSASGPPLSRIYGDLDLATPKRHARQLEDGLQDLGFVPDSRFNALHGHRRMAFDAPDHTWGMDVFVEEFTMCHSLHLGGRLGDPSYTLKPADLVLTKLQIVELTSKDAVDLAALLLDVKLTEDDAGINVRYLSDLLASDWGWWRTLTGNLSWLGSAVPTIGLDGPQEARVLESIAILRQTIDERQKSLRWRARAILGERITWYEEPEERGTASQRGTKVVSDSTAGAGLFIRSTSGLVREMGFRDAFSIGITFTNFGSIALFFYLTLALFPGADLTLPLILAALVSALVTLVYAQLIAAMPRSGADYVYGARVVGPVFGGWVGGIPLWTWVLVIGFVAVTISSLFIPFMLTGAGHALSWHALQTAGDKLPASKTAEFLVGGGLVLVAGLFTMLGPRSVARLLFWGFVLGLVTMVLIVFEALTHSRAQFAIDHGKSIGHAHAFAQVLAAGRQAGAPAVIIFSATLASTPYVIQQYTGFSAANFSGGELKRPSSTFIRSVMAVLLLATAMFVICWLGLRHLVGIPFLQAASSLSTNGASIWTHLTGGASPLVQFYAFVVAGSPVSVHSGLRLHARVRGDHPGPDPGFLAHRVRDVVRPPASGEARGCQRPHPRAAQVDRAGDCARRRRHLPRDLLLHVRGPVA
jgi:hypothetical protein